jgi:hypothetical protein
MLGPKILSGILIVLPATILLTAQSGFGASTSGECRASPGASAPAGLHWYYRVDRANNRHCWFLHSDGMQIIAHEDAQSLKPRRENGAKQARETTPTQSSTKQIAPPQLETAPPTRDETFLTPSLPEYTAIDFAAPGRYLPKSVDLDARELATASNSYVAEDEVTEAEEQMPSASYNVRGVGGGLRQNSAGVVINGQRVEIVSHRSSRRDARPRASRCAVRVTSYKGKCDAAGAGPVSDLRRARWGCGWFFLDQTEFGADFWAARSACEGIVSKRLGSLYRSGRSAR